VKISAPKLAEQARADLDAVALRFPEAKPLLEDLVRKRPQLFVGKDSKRARDEFYPHYAAYFRDHAVKGKYAMEVSREEFDKRAAPDGPLYVGSPQEIVDKIGLGRELFRHDRYLGQIDIGGLPYAKVGRRGTPCSCGIA